MVNQVFKIILPRESAIVNTMKEKGAIAAAILNDGEEKRFEHIGHRLATISAQIQMQDQLTKKGMH